MLGSQETDFGFEHNPNLADHVTRIILLLKPNNHALTLSTSILILRIYYKMKMEPLRKKMWRTYAKRRKRNDEAELSSKDYPNDKNLNQV